MGQNLLVASDLRVAHPFLHKKIQTFTVDSNLTLISNYLELSIELSLELSLSLIFLRLKFALYQLLSLTYLFLSQFSLSQRFFTNYTFSRYPVLSRTIHVFYPLHGHVADKMG